MTSESFRTFVAALCCIAALVTDISLNFEKMCSGVVQTFRTYHNRFLCRIWPLQSAQTFFSDSKIRGVMPILGGLPYSKRLLRRTLPLHSVNFKIEKSKSSNENICDLHIGSKSQNLILHRILTDESLFRFGQKNISDVTRKSLGESCTAFLQNRSENIWNFFSGPFRGCVDVARAQICSRTRFLRLEVS